LVKKKRQRKCSICSTLGHNAATCPDKNKTIEEIIGTKSSLSRAAKKEKELGHQILKDKKKKVERIEIDGLIPQKDMWLVNLKRKKIAGKICKVKRNGDIVWRSVLSATVITPQEKMIENGYSYLKDLEVEMLGWEIVGRLNG